MAQSVSLVSRVSTVDHLPDKETRKRKPKKTFEIDFNDDVNFDTYFRTTRVRTLFVNEYKKKAKTVDDPPGGWLQYWSVLVWMNQSKIFRFVFDG